MADIAGWTRTRHTADSKTHDIYRKGHSTLTDGRVDMAVERVLTFFAERLKGQAPRATQD